MKFCKENCEKFEDNFKKLKELDNEYDNKKEEIWEKYDEQISVLKKKRDEEIKSMINPITAKLDKLQNWNYKFSVLMRSKFVVLFNKVHKNSIMNIFDDRRGYDKMKFSITTVKDEIYDYLIPISKLAEVVEKGENELNKYLEYVKTVNEAL